VTHQESVELVLRFWREVWNPPYNRDVIDELLSEDFSFVNAGIEIGPRAAFKEWVAAFGSRIADASIQPVDTFASADGTKVVSRWKATGKNAGLFGLPADGKPMDFTGISIWEVRDGRLTRQWLERSAFELYQKLKA
jgi:steroid delta-isomerase-like uncharacterized protein